MKIIIEAESVEELKALLITLTYKIPVSKGTSISRLTMTVRSTNCLIAEGIDSIEALSTMSKNDLMKIPGLGMKGVSEVIEALNNWAS